MRNGKIARLPRNIRTELNRRLLDNEPGTLLVEWLNALPEVQATLRRDFDSRPITAANLTEWKQGGFREWTVRQDTLTQVAELAENAHELNDATAGLMPDHLTTIVTSRYVSEFSAIEESGMTDEQRTRLRALGGVCRDVVGLQRGSLNARRIKIEQARLEQSREKSGRDILDYFIRWIEYPKVLACIRDEALSPEDLKNRLRTLFGIEQPQDHEPIPFDPNDG